VEEGEEQRTVLVHALAPRVRKVEHRALEAALEALAAPAERLTKAGRVHAVLHVCTLLSRARAQR